MPLTNAHTHLELGWLADQCPPPPGRDFVSWMLAADAQRRKLSAMACFVETKFRQAVEAGLQALQAAGVTHVADVSSTGSSVYPLLASGLQGVVYIEVMGQFAEQADRALAMARYVIEQARPHERGDLRIGLALHAPYAVHPALWKKGLAYARAENLPLCIHIAQSRAEYDWMLSDRGPLADTYREMGLSLSAPRRSPVAYLDDLGALELQPLLIHAAHVDADDVQRIKASGSRVVYCPRSADRLQNGRFPLELYQQYGVPVYLGTESLACAPSLDVREEIVAAQAQQAGYADPDSLRALAEQPLVI
jgi:cytosine/adenosine deaminase-related metal-dependent hydrolase